MKQLIIFLTLTLFFIDFVTYYISASYEFGVSILGVPSPKAIEKSGGRHTRKV